MDKWFFGVDVSKEWVDVARRGRKAVRIANTEEAIGAWLDGLGRDRVALVAFEATGGYERALRRCLRAAGVPFTRVSAARLEGFRALRGVKAKTDPIDAGLLAEYAELDLATRGLAPLVEGDEALRELSARRRQVLDALHAERCRLAMAESPVVRASVEAVVEALEKAAATVEAALEAHVRGSEGLRAMAAVLRTLKGVGPVTVHTLLGELPELGRLSGKEIAALVGLAPITRRSGKKEPRAQTGFGRPGVRRVLFNAARCAIRHNPVMKAFYERLAGERRRPGKVALVAVMRKMLVTLNAMAREGKPWSGSPEAAKAAAA